VADGVRSYHSAEAAFLSRLRESGIREPIEWLPHEDFAFLGHTMVLRGDVQKLLSADIARVFSLLEGDPCTFALVAVSDVAYCTLLMDTFGTEDEAEFDESQNAFYLVNAYFTGIVRVERGLLDWFWTKLVLERVKRPLSSLDFAFGRSQVSAT
jgi:hypothetical protein